MEEPPKKVTKYEMESQYLEGEVMEDGQEEWLSEGVLTDDDYNPVNSQHSQQTEPDESECSAVNQDDSMQSLTEDPENDMSELRTESNNIEETLNNFENKQNHDISDELETFLIRKSDGKPLSANRDVRKESDVDESAKQSEDDGNDTDDLLRVLDDSDQKAQQLRTEESKQEDESSDDDDDYIFNGSKVSTRLQAAKNALKRASATKAEPEDEDITDCSSSDEIATVKKMFMMKHTDQKSNVKTPSDNKEKTIEQNVVKKQVIRVADRPLTAPKFTVSTPFKTYPHKRASNQALVKKPAETPTTPDESPEKPVETAKKPVEMPKKPVVMPKNPVETPKKPAETQKKPAETQKKPAEMPKKRAETPMKSAETPEKLSEEIVGEKSFDDDDADVVEILDPKPGPKSQQMMKPEQMDEEIPTDAESDEEEDSIYDELPSSDSEDLNDWFTLDIRAERAGDYLALLGDKAYQLLTEEKRRVAARLANLKKSLTALTESGKGQAEKLREATINVAELDAMLKAA